MLLRQKGNLGTLSTFKLNPVHNCVLGCSKHYTMEISRAIELLVRKHTAFRSLSDMCNAPSNYTPSLRTKTGRTPTDRMELSIIAKAYNEYQIEQGDTRRAFES